MPKGYSVDVEKKKCVTPECRGSYVHILEPRPLPESEKLAWGMQLLFDKENPDVKLWMGDMKEVYAQILIDKFGLEEAKKRAATVRIPLRDGDSPDEADKELEGLWFMNSNNIFRQPHIIGPMGKPLNAAEVANLTVDDIYSGAHYRVMLEYWYYDKAGNKGISSSVTALMKTRDDSNLGSGTTPGEAETAFGAFKDEAASMMTSTDESEGEAADASAKEADEFDFMS